MTLSKQRFEEEKQQQEKLTFLNIQRRNLSIFQKLLQLYNYKLNIELKSSFNREMHIRYFYLLFCQALPSPVRIPYL
jgi:hypothetical protein